MSVRTAAGSAQHRTVRGLVFVLLLFGAVLSSHGVHGASTHCGGGAPAASAHAGTHEGHSAAGPAGRSWQDTASAQSHERPGALDDGEPAGHDGGLDCLAAFTFLSLTLALARVFARMRGRSWLRCSPALLPVVSGAARGRPPSPSLAALSVLRI